MLPEEARLTVDVLTAALAGDPDPTPRLGVRDPLRAVRSAWRALRGTFSHATDCPQEEHGIERCDCGLPEFFARMEAL